MTTKEKSEFVTLIREQSSKVLLLYSVEESALKGSLITMPEEYTSLQLSEEIDQKIIGLTVKTIKIRTEQAENELENLLKAWRNIRKGKSS